MESISSDNIILDNTLDSKFKKTLIEGNICLVVNSKQDYSKYVIDIVIYLNGPQYWAELVLTNSGQYTIEEIRDISHLR